MYRASDDTEIGAKRVKNGPEYIDTRPEKKNQTTRK